MPIPLLVAIEIDAERLSRIAAAGFEVHSAPRGPQRASVVQSARDRIRAVLTNGSLGFDADEIAQLPKLEIICALGAGYERIDLAAAQARGIIVTNGAGTNDSSVADHAMMLLLAIARGIVQADAAVRRGD
jgi:lactate dehydrogenase-like 2-hydroxyacid dehydrogenase